MWSDLKFRLRSLFRRRLHETEMDQTMRPIAVGIVAGLVACAAVSHLLEDLLFGISPLDPRVFAGVSLFLGFVAALSAYLPARRATRVDPLIALRYE